MNIILSLIVSLAACVQGMCNDLSWNAPQTISGVGVSDPQIVMHSNGAVVTAWVEGGLIKARALPAGGSWGATATLSAVGSSLPKLGIDSSGTVTAIWLQAGVVRAATLPLNGSWSAAVSVSSSGASLPDLAVDSTGNAVAVWARNGLIETSTKMLAGAWGLATSFLNMNSDNPRVSIGGGMVGIGWHAVSSGQDQILGATTTVGGLWGTAKVLTGTAGHNANYPAIALDSSGNALIVWYRSDLGGSSNTDYINVLVLGATLAPGAASWTVPVQLNSTIGTRNPSQLRLKAVFDTNRNGVAMWSSSFDGATFNIESNIRGAGGNWTGSTPFVTQNPYAFQFDFAINSFGDTLVGYMDFDGINLNILATETMVQGLQQNFFTIPQTVSTGASNGYPRVATVLTGNVVNAAAVWINSPDGLTTQIQAATGSKSVISAPVNVSVVQNATSFVFYNDYYNTLTWQPSVDPSVIGYVIYRDGIAVTNVVASTLQFVDHNQAQNGPITYGVASFDDEFCQSITVTGSLP